MLVRDAAISGADFTSARTMPIVPITVAAFYKFVAIDDCQALRRELRAHCDAGAIRGTALIAPEGLNATLAGRTEAVSDLLAWLRADARFADLAVKIASASAPPFQRLKVKVKREIITFGAPGCSPAERTGARVPPAAWNALIRDPDVVVVDTRNAYEVAAGTFEGAINPGIRSFREFAAFVARDLDPKAHGKVAMFCTGGIRCEKASAYLLSRGFGEVYQLDGGVLAYLAQVPPKQSLWRGSCFVFDERGEVGHEQAEQQAGVEGASRDGV